MSASGTSVGTLSVALIVFGLTFLVGVGSWWAYHDGASWVSSDGLGTSGIGQRISDLEKQVRRWDIRNVKDDLNSARWQHGMSNDWQWDQQTPIDLPTNAEFERIHAEVSEALENTQ